MIQQGGRLENVPKRTKYGFTFQRKFPRDKLRSASWRILMYLTLEFRERLFYCHSGSRLGAPSEMSQNWLHFYMYFSTGQFAQRLLAESDVLSLFFSTIFFSLPLSFFLSFSRETPPPRQNIQIV